MKDWSTGFVTANGIKIHYYRTGGDKPQIVLNHGSMDDGLCWTRVAKALQQHYDIIMLDTRGHGLSDSGNGDYEPATRAKDLAEVITQLGLNKPIVGGHSLGAEASYQLAALYPDIPRAIFLEDPPIAPPGEPMFGGDIGKMGAGGLKLMVVIMQLVKTMPTFLGKIIARKMMPTSPDDEIIPWVNSKKRYHKDFSNALQNADNAVIPSPFETLKKIKVPTLLLMGDREKGSIISKETAKQMNEVVSDFKIAHFQGANHDIRRSQFEGYMTALNSFLAEVFSECVDLR